MLARDRYLSFLFRLVFHGLGFGLARVFRFKRYYYPSIHPVRVLDSTKTNKPPQKKTDIKNARRPNPSHQTRKTIHKYKQTNLTNGIKPRLPRPFSPTRLAVGQTFEHLLLNGGGLKVRH